MSRRFKCQKCGEAILLDDQPRTQVQCPRCGKRLKIRTTQTAAVRRVRPGMARALRRRRRRLIRRITWSCVLGTLVVAGVLLAIFSRPKVEEQYSNPLVEQERYQTKLIPNAFRSEGPAPQPPPGTVNLVRYASPAGTLAAYVTPDPGDGKKHPAVIWAHAGFGGIGPDSWDPGGSSSAFRRAGLVVMTPSWRGENENPGQFEMFYGEVQDAVAAVEYTAGLPYVDPNRVYFAGLTTGGTIALLVAASTDKVRAVFSIGGVLDIDRLLVQTNGQGYGNTPFDWHDSKERGLRSPIRYCDGMMAPVFHFEGESFSANPGDAARMESQVKKAGKSMSAFAIPENGGITLLNPINSMIARKIRTDTGPSCSISFTMQEIVNAGLVGSP